MIRFPGLPAMTCKVFTGAESATADTIHGPVTIPPYTWAAFRRFCDGWEMVPATHVPDNTNGPSEALETPA